MRKKTKFLLTLTVVLFSIAVCLGLVACSGGETERTLESIAITTPPNKVEYVEGETFDATGMVVTAYYSDDTSEAVTGYTVSKTTALSTSDTSITITYGGKTATQAITVTAAQTDQADTDGSEEAGNAILTLNDETYGIIVLTFYDNGTFDLEFTGYTYYDENAENITSSSNSWSYSGGELSMTLGDTTVANSCTIENNNDGSVTITFLTVTNWSAIYTLTEDYLSILGGEVVTLFTLSKEAVSWQDSAYYLDLIFYSDGTFDLKFASQDPILSNWSYSDGELSITLGETDMYTCDVTNNSDGTAIITITVMNTNVVYELTSDQLSALAAVA